MIWLKNNHANHLLSKKAPLSIYQDIVVFNKFYDINCEHPLRNYFNEVLNFIGKKKVEIVKTIGQSIDHCFRIDSNQFSLCMEEAYLQLINQFHIDKMPGFMTYAQLKEINKKFQPIFNLPKGKNFIHNVFQYDKDKKHYHPTQKPVALIHQLIEIYTNENDMILDFTAGGGTTGVAAMETNRKCVLIEKEQKYCEIIVKRLQDKERQIKERLF